MVLPNVYYLAVALKLWCSNYSSHEIIHTNESSLFPSHHPPFIGHFQLSDYAGKTLCHKQQNNICEKSLWKPLHELSKPKYTLGSKVHYLQSLTFSLITCEFFSFFFFFHIGCKGIHGQRNITNKISVYSCLENHWIEKQQNVISIILPFLFGFGVLQDKEWYWIIWV